MPIRCPHCTLVSNNSHDEHEGYCGWCHDWTRDGPLFRHGAGSFVLNGDRQPVPATTAEAGAFLQSERCTVARDIIQCSGEPTLISTRFMTCRLGMRASQPLWFETVLMGGSKTLGELRYHSWDRAARGHRLVAHMARARRFAPTAGERHDD